MNLFSNSMIISLSMNIWRARHLFCGTEDLRENHGRNGRSKIFSEEFYTTPSWNMALSSKILNHFLIVLKSLHLKFYFESFIYF